jgi:hypothetical protein
VRKVPTPSGPFPFQLYFEDLAEIDEICLEALERQSLLPFNPAPIRIERFVEKEFKTALRYEDLGPDNLGCTIFNSSGAVEAILVSRSLEEQNTIPARRRVRSTVAHEAGHGLLHGSLFIEATFRILEKTNGAYCADRKTFSGRLSGRTGAAGGNFRQTKRLGVSCFPDRL